MTATAVGDRSFLPGPTWPPSAPPPSFPLADRGRVVLADDPCGARFSGADPEYAGIYLHARYFDPQLGIFLSPDPIGVAGGMNEYGYGLGNPVNGADRSGLAMQWVCSATPPNGAGCGTNPSCRNPVPGVECWFGDYTSVTAPAPPPADPMVNPFAPNIGILLSSG